MLPRHPGGLSLWFNDVPPQSRESGVRPVLLIQGLGMQATEWPIQLVAGIAVRRRVVSFDNRDAGLSPLCGPACEPELRPEDFPGWNTPLLLPAYNLADMAADTLNLLDACAIDRVHLVGYSMGGMIAQILAARVPDRVASVVGLMTSAGQPWLQMQASAETHMRRSIVYEPDPDRRIDELLAAEEVYSAGAPLPDMVARRMAVQTSLERAYRPAGIWRQACAIRASGDRREMLHRIKAPYLGIHGVRDPVISVDQAMACHNLIAKARMHILPGAGHALSDDIARSLLPLLESLWTEFEAGQNGN
jgi:pimeloyl-ACP methyl ester carboxylesterase